MYTSLFKQSDVRVTQVFKGAEHKGLDLSRGIVRQPIYFPNKGVEGYVWKILIGYTAHGTFYKDAPIVYIKHKDGSGSRYIHSAKEDVKVVVGQTVKPGDRICSTGSSGYTTGDHLHFEWLSKWDDLNTRIDPAPYVVNDLVAPVPNDCEERIKGLQMEVARLVEALGASDTGKKLADERIAFLEQAKALSDREIDELMKEIEACRVQKERFEKQYQEVVTELNALKEGRDDWINRLADVLHKLFGMK